MTGIESLDRIRDESARENILQIADSFVAAVHPLQIILFGSFADGTYTDEKEWDGKGITDTIFNGYFRYHQERIENAFEDIDSLLATGRHAS